MQNFFLYMNREGYLVVITGEHCIQEWLYTQGWSFWHYGIHDYWAMSAPHKGDGLTCADLFMSLHIFQFQFSRQGDSWLMSPFVFPVIDSKSRRRAHSVKNRVVVITDLPKVLWEFEFWYLITSVFKLLVGNYQLSTSDAHYNPIVNTRGFCPIIIQSY